MPGLKSSAFGFHTVTMVVTVLVVAALGVGGWLVYQAKYNNVNCRPGTSLSASSAIAEYKAFIADVKSNNLSCAQKLADIPNLSINSWLASPIGTNLTQSTGHQLTVSDAIAGVPSSFSPQLFVTASYIPFADISNLVVPSAQGISVSYPLATTEGITAPGVIDFTLNFLQASNLNRYLFKHKYPTGSLILFGANLDVNPS